ncbi:MAG TPA: NAD(P)/FAD-dependent oxidoreductase [Pseudonocardia sp.]|nr:NAD(P)/FAD-dependent oxidoreductase [Pseudonocardia sp.]
MSDRQLDPVIDAVVVGAGFSGLYMLHRLRDTLGMSVQVFEAGDDVGGTWYWNRYPGARCDSESYFYSFSDHFSPELLQEWTWSERFAGQPEILSYLQHVADRWDLRRDIRFSTKVVAAAYDEAANAWTVTTDAGDEVTVRFLITAVGCLSAANWPEFNGRERFRGEQFHTGLWPHEGVDFTGKRVAVIGTGATSVQATPEIAEQAEHVYVFQRTPNYCIAGGNGPVSPESVAEIKGNYPEIWARTRETGFGFPYCVPELQAFDVPEQERRQRYQDAWEQGGFRIGVAFDGLLYDAEANETASEFIREKIRQRVRDPKVAEMLTPTDHPFFTKRPPLENGYYDTFNRDNVTLLDVRNSPIQEITEAGVRTAEGEFEVDAIVFATGFDAMTGTLFKMGITGRGGLSLREKWADGPRTYLGLATHGFPNLFTITGPQSPSVLSNMVVSIEQHADWITDCLGYLREHGYDRVEAMPDAEQQWVDHHNEVTQQTLLPRANSWWVGANIPGKPRNLYPYVGGCGVYREICDEVAARDYDGFTMAGDGGSAGQNSGVALRKAMAVLAGSEHAAV